MIDPRVQQVVDKLAAVWSDPQTPQGIKDWIGGLATTLLETRDPEPGFKKGDPLPNSLGALADVYADVRQRRLDMEKAAERVKERETELFNIALNYLKSSADTGASGERYRVQKVSKPVQNVKDWDAFYAFVKKHDAFEMLQKRLSDKSVLEWKDTNGAFPDGVEQREIDTLSFTKV